MPDKLDLVQRDENAVNLSFSLEEINEARRRQLLIMI